MRGLLARSSLLNLDLAGGPASSAQSVDYMRNAEGMCRERDWRLGMVGFRLLRLSGLGGQNPTDLAGTCFGGKFVVSRAGEAYDVQVRGLHRKFLLKKMRLDIIAQSCLVGRYVSIKQTR